MAGDALKVSEIAILLALMAEAQEVSNVDLKDRYGFTLTGESKSRPQRHEAGDEPEGGSCVRARADRPRLGPVPRRAHGSLPTEGRHRWGCAVRAAARSASLPHPHRAEPV